MDAAKQDVILRHLVELYGPAPAERALQEIGRLIEAHRAVSRLAPAPPIGPGDVFLITYPDQLRQAGQAPLRTLADWLETELPGTIGGVHLLPFFPSSSDDGFSVVDFQAVDPALGDWEHIRRIAGRVRLMVDAILNHVSRDSAWFRAFLERRAPYLRFFHALDPAVDLSHVVRPREHPLLTPIARGTETVNVWTTFSPDQIDLNYAEPDVLLAVIGALLFYIRQGAQWIRLDAAAYLWKQIGTSCVHLPQTHSLLKLLRAVIEAAAPGVRLITETNVPHLLNLSYFGRGDEAHLVYSFPLPPLVLHAFHSRAAALLSDWVASLPAPPPGSTFFNILSSHDGVGLPPVDGILPEAEIEALVNRTRERGGAVSYRRAGARRLPYELNTTFLDALSEAGELDSSPARAVARFVCAHAILLSLRGVPAIYFHSLVGSRNDHRGSAATGRARSLHREKLTLERLEQERADPRLVRGAVWRGLSRWISIRRAHPAFHPDGAQEVVNLGSGVFAILRTSPAEEERIACLHEIGGRAGRVRLPRSADLPASVVDLDTSEILETDSIPLAPYQVRWLNAAAGERGR